MVQPGHAGSNRGKEKHMTAADKGIRGDASSLFLCKKIDWNKI